MFYSVFMIECNSFVCACTSKTCLAYIHVTNSIGYSRLHAVYYRLFVYIFYSQVESVMKYRGAMLTVIHSL